MRLRLRTHTHTIYEAPLIQILSMHLSNVIFLSLALVTLPSLTFLTALFNDLTIFLLTPFNHLDLQHHHPPPPIIRSTPP